MFPVYSVTYVPGLYRQPSNPIKRESVKGAQDCYTVSPFLASGTVPSKWRRSMWIGSDRQRVTVKHHSGLDSARDEASGARSLDRVPDLDLGMTDRLPNQALDLVPEVS